jgi:hypothetical protein
MASGTSVKGVSGVMSVLPLEHCTVYQRVTVTLHFPLPYLDNRAEKIKNVFR